MVPEQERSSDNPLLAVLLALRATGHMPFSVSQGRLQFYLCSWPMLYSVLITVVNVIFTVDIMLWAASIPIFWADFDMTIITLVSFVLMAFVFHPLLFTWSETPHIAAAADRWPHILDSCTEVTGKYSISSTLTVHSGKWVILVAIFTVFFQCLPIFYTMIARTVKISFIFGMILFYINMLAWFWLVYAHLISKAATLLKLSFVELMEQEGAPSVEVIRKYRDLWLELNTFTGKMTNAIGNSLSAFHFSLVLCLELSMFRVASSLITRRHLPIPAFVITQITTTLILLLHSASHWADTKIRRDITVAVLSSDLHKLADDQLHEVDCLLSAIEDSKNNFILKDTLDISRKAVLEVRSSKKYSPFWSSLSSLGALLSNQYKRKLVV